MSEFAIKVLSLVTKFEIPRTQVNVFEELKVKT